MVGACRHMTVATAKTFQAEAVAVVTQAAPTTPTATTVTTTTDETGGVATVELAAVVAAVARVAVTNVAIATRAALATVDLAAVLSVQYAGFGQPSPRGRGGRRAGHGDLLDQPLFERGH